MCKGIRPWLARATLVLALVGFPAAMPGEVPYPPNPNPCTAPDSPPGCIEAEDFHRYLFLPTTDPPTVPNDFGNDWRITSARSGNPAIDSNPQELFGVTGASVDRAWQVTTGRPDVIIAVLDSGIRWGEPLPDLVNKFYLNRAELPAPEGSEGNHDRNRDGVFNVADYLAGGPHAQDSRVRDENGNGMIDPEDLIFLFSDGVDDDRNGYVDDISGWDFYEDDNDPLDEVRYGHGTGESEDSGAEANNGRGGVGTCPNCMLLEVRVGDSFIVDVNNFAQGVLFAVDSGARVIQEALGTLNNSAFGQAAIDYAYRRGVIVVASAADESSNHNNYPANYNHTLDVNSVTKFAELGGVRQTPPSYLYLNGCTNFGGHITVSVPSSACSSEATGRSSGMAGLIVSAALNEIDRGALTTYPADDGSPTNHPLSAEEIRQIFIATADDINFDAREDTDPPLPQNYASRIPVPGLREMRRFPSIAGWDQYFGYGRVNADSAVRRVRAGRIPPEAGIVAPAWFATLSPASRQPVPVTGRVAANRAESFRYVVEVAPGVQQAESAFVTVFRSDERTQAIDGTLAMLDPTAIAALMPHGTTGAPVRDDESGRGDPERFAFTVRVRVTDNLGNRGEDRRTLFLHHDPDLLPGFPRPLHADGAASPLMADIDADAKEELILATSNGEVHALRADGSELPGWPALTDPIEVHEEAPAFREGGIAIPRGAIMGGIAVGDLDGDGSLETVAADLQGKVYVWNADASLRAGFPVSTLPQYSHSWRSERDPSTPEGRVPDRTNRHDRDNRLGRSILGGVALGNLDGSADGSLEILAGAFDRHVYAWHHNGTPVPGWPVLLKDPEKVAGVDPETNEVTLQPGSGAEIGTKIVTPPSLGDLNGDGRPEVLSAVNEEYSEPYNAVFTNLFINLFITAGALTPGNTRVYAIHPNGTMHGENGIEKGWNPDAFVAGWPVKTTMLTLNLLPLVGTGSNGPPALADLDADGIPEIATMSAIGPVYIFRANGEPFLGRHPGGEAVTLESDVFGAAANSDDMPAIGSVGGVMFTELLGREQGFHVVAPTSGFTKLLDTSLPAQQLPADNHLSVWNIDGTFVNAFPRHMNDLQFFASATSADLNGDGMPEVLQGSGVWELHAFDFTGAEPAGWPKHTGGWTVTSPAVGDLDGDGKIEVAHVTREGNLFVWRTSGDECGFHPWRRFHHDEWSTGNYATDARPPGAVLAAQVPRTVFGNRLEISLRPFPGDDLYCGSPAEIDVRFATHPLRNLDHFNAARRVSQVTFSGSGRAGGTITLADDKFEPGSNLFLAMVARDEANNLSPLFDLGAVSFQAAATATPSASATPLATATSTATVTQTISEVFPSADDDSGCAIGGSGGESYSWLILVGVVLLAAHRWRLNQATSE